MRIIRDIILNRAFFILIDSYDRPERRMCIAAGNGIVGGTPLENIEAYLQEALSYGSEHRQKMKNFAIIHRFLLVLGVEKGYGDASILRAGEVAEWFKAAVC